MQPLTKDSQTLDYVAITKLADGDIAPIREEKAVRIVVDQ